MVVVRIQRRSLELELTLLLLLHKRLLFLLLLLLSWQPWKLRPPLKWKGTVNDLEEVEVLGTGRRLLTLGLPAVLAVREKSKCIGL